ncbi:hypothetical protein pb186bvf_008653 [Paramecium bursaria]
MISKMHLERMKKAQQPIDENELDQFNRYLQKDSQQHLPQQINSLSYSKIKVNMPVITEHQNETPDQTRLASANKMSKDSPQKTGRGEQIKLYVRVIFKFYATFGNRTNTRFLKSNKFLKMLSDAQIMPQLIHNLDADMLYSSETKNSESLTLEQFQSLLPKLSLLIYQDLPIQQSFYKLYNECFEGLAQKILQYTDFGQQIAFILKPINNEFREIVKPIAGQLAKLHGFVFSDQSQKISKVQWQYIQFLSQCELVPNYVNQSQAQLIFDNIHIRQPILDLPENQNYILGLNHFIESLILISSTIPQLDEFSQFRIILDKIESSEGFNKFLRNLNRTQSDSVRLQSNLSKSRLKQSYIDQGSQKKLTEQSVRYSENKMMTESQIGKDYIPVLKRLFDHYAQLGEQSNISALKNTKFNKLLAHANILNEHLSVIEADMIYAKLTGIQWVKSQIKENNLCNGRMTFSQFLISLKMLSEKCKLQTQQLIEEFLLPLEKDISDESKNEILAILVELLQDEQIIELYNIIQPIFDQYYQEYQRNMMVLTDFLKFCMDFDLSNILVSQNRLIQVFHAVSSLNQQKIEYRDMIYIDNAQFVEAISILAVLVYQTVPNKIQRILFLLERIFQSSKAFKVVKLQNKFLNVLDDIKAQFLEQPQNEPSQPYEFDDLVKNY